MPVAFGLILFGLLFLLRNLDMIQGDIWDYVWPVVFIIIGISIIAGKTGKTPRT